MNTKHFIIIDDDPINNLITKAVIKSAYGNNADISTFTNPELGLEYIENEVQQLDNEIQVVLLLDINMPNMSGWEVLECFDKLDEAVTGKIKVFMLSSSVHRDDKEKATNNKYVNGYIEKPLSAQKLEAALGYEYEYKKAV